MSAAPEELKPTSHEDLKQASPRVSPVKSFFGRGGIRHDMGSLKLLIPHVSYNGRIKICACQRKAISVPNESPKLRMTHESIGWSSVQYRAWAHVVSDD